MFYVNVHEALNLRFGEQETKRKREGKEGEELYSILKSYACNVCSILHSDAVNSRSFSFLLLGLTLLVRFLYRCVYALWRILIENKSPVLSCRYSSRKREKWVREKDKIANLVPHCVLLLVLPNVEVHTSLHRVLVLLLLRVWL